MEKSTVLFASLVCVIFLSFWIDNAFSCGGGRRRTCTYQTCRSEWNSWSSYPYQGSCRWQTRTPRHTYSTHKRNGGCPSSQRCTTSRQQRYYCSCRQMYRCWWATWGNWGGHIPHNSCRAQTRYRSILKTFGYTYRAWSCNGITSNCPRSTDSQSRTLCSCRQIDHCWWASWGSWGGGISQNTCGTQRRYRQALKRFTYTYRTGSCNGVVSDCPRSTDSQHRTWCNCRKAAKCTPTNWSNWAGHVPNGQCRDQTNYRDFSPTYQYIQQINNCHGVGASSCRSRETNKRTYCVCPYKSCSEGGWNAWALMTSWTGQCPKEERFKHWSATIRYRGAHFNCKGIGPQSCPASQRQERSKDVKCPKLSAPPKGQLVDQSCDGDHSSCTAICQVRCPTGYQLSGARYVTCQGNEKWSGSLGTCTDSAPPVITCPTVKPFSNQPNKNYAMIDLPDATATDNSGAVPRVTKSQVSPLKVLVGSPVDVIYTATDEAGNTKTCKITITVLDTEPPKVTFCPDDKIIQTEKIPHPVIWREPQFEDNVDTTVDRVPSHYNGQAFTKGKHHVRYIARDKAFNNVTCEFSIQVSMFKCPVFPPPKHGASACNINKAGVEEVYICTVSCEKNYWFVQGQGMPVAYDYIVCGDDGGWRGQNSFDPTNPMAGFFIRIPKDSTPWPDCAEGSPPSEVTKPFKVLGGNCKDAQTMERLKQAFITAMQTDLIIRDLFCNINSQHCTVENVRVTCSTRRKRSTGQTSNMMEIAFDFIVKDGKPSKDQKVAIAKMQKIMQDLGKLSSSIKRIAPSNLQTTAANVQVTENSAKLACEPGMVFEVVNGSGSETDRSKCLKCPVGTRYVSTMKHCAVCTPGEYQDKEGQLACKKCPKGYSTHGNHATNYTECKKICTPGTYSSTGLATCLACPRGTYQPTANSSACLTCPTGKGTEKEGSVALSDCTRGAIQVFVRSEGCEDRGKYAGCGRAYIKVNGVDKSPHGRGYNFVVISERTGQVESTRSFDTHGRSSATRDMLNFVNGLSNGKIVLVAVQNEGARLLTADGVRALKALGGSEPVQREYRASYALVGYKGIDKVTWVRQKMKPRRQGPTEISLVIPLN